MGNQHTKDQDTVIHVRVTEDERRKMAARALSEHRPLSNWARVQLLKAFEPVVHDQGPIGEAFERPRVCGYTTSPGEWCEMPKGHPGPHGRGSRVPHAPDYDGDTGDIG